MSIHITHGSVVLRIHLTFESFRTRPSTRVGIDSRHAIVRTVCVVVVVVMIYVICVKRPHQSFVTVGMFRGPGPAAYLQM